MKKSFKDILNDAETPVEKLITDEITVGAASGLDVDRVTSLTLEKTGVKLSKMHFIRRYYKQIGAVAACFVLMIGVFVGVRLWGNGDSFTKPDSSDDLTSNFSKLDGIVWKNDAVNSPEGEAPDVVVPPEIPGADVDKDDNLVETGGSSVETTGRDDKAESDSPTDIVNRYLTLWDKIIVTAELGAALNETDDVLAVRVDGTPVIVPPEYVYNGKTIAEMQDAVLECNKKEERIFAAFEYGFDLVYGEDIYKVGSPSGELWSYEKYVKVLSEFGDEFDLLYAEYEKFLTEYELWGEVSDDIGLYWEKLEGWYLQKVKDESSNVYFELINAEEQYIRENPRSFDEKSKFGIAAASLDIKVFDKEGHAYIFVTSEQFEALCEKIDGNNMIFDLASKNAFDSEFDADGNHINADTTEITEAPVPETEAEEITDVLYEADTTCVEGSMYEEETSIYSLSPETGK